MVDSFQIHSSSVFTNPTFRSSIFRDIDSVANELRAAIVSSEWTLALETHKTALPPCYEISVLIYILIKSFQYVELVIIPKKVPRKMHLLMMISDWLRDGRPRVLSSSPGRVKNFLGRPTDTGAHAASYPMGIGGSFPGGKAAGAWS
jgi:hypothetical protein